MIGPHEFSTGFSPSFPLLAFHFKHTSLFTDQWIYLVYAMAMGVDALAGLGLGILFDRWKHLIPDYSPSNWVVGNPEGIRDKG
ncbi:MAG TPA: hypothetical protein VJ964_04520 [Balneolaceae bacterium]|nr:hypothetical protein [Balneolaceae bacterium]